MSNILSASTLMQLQNQAVDAGANFLIGQATSAFDPNFDQSKAGAMSMVGGTLGVVTSAASIAGNAMDTAVTSINVTTETLAYITNCLTSYVSEAIAKVLSLPTAYIAERTTEKINEGTKKELKEIKDKLTKLKETRVEEESKKQDEESNKNIQKNASEKVKKITYTVTSTLNKAKKELDSISAYVAQGPRWMKRQIDDYSDKVITQSTGFISKTVDDFEKTKLDWAETMATKAANVIVSNQTKKALQSTKDSLDKIEVSKKKLILKAKALAAQAIMKIKGLLGG